MALTAVGDSQANFFYDQDVFDFDVVYTADTTFAEGDVLLLEMFVGGSYDFVMPSGWTEVTVNTGGEPGGVYYFYHTVTALEDGNATLTYNFENNEPGGNIPGDAWQWFSAGVAIRGATGVTSSHSPDISGVPFVDYKESGSGASPQTATIPVHTTTVAATDTAVSLHFAKTYDSSGLHDLSGAPSYVWSDATDLGKFDYTTSFYEYWAAGYVIGTTGDDDEAASGVTSTWSGGDTAYVFHGRGTFVLEGPAVETPTPTVPFHSDYRRRRFINTELPYDVAARGLRP